MLRRGWLDAAGFGCEVAATSVSCFGTTLSLVSLLALPVTGFKFGSILRRKKLKGPRAANEPTFLINNHPNLQDLKKLPSSESTVLILDCVQV